MKHTKGKVELAPQFNFDIVIMTKEKSIAKCIYENNTTFDHETYPEFEANAELIAEAFNVTNECGLTPRQLLEHNNKMLEALKELQKQCNENGLMTGHLFELCQKAIVNN